MALRKFKNFDQFVNENYSHRIAEAGEAVQNEPGEGASSPLVVNLSDTFQSGKWKLNPTTSQAITAQLPKIEQYIKSHANDSITITIESGESQVPNKDAEAQPSPDGQLPNLQPGQLAQNRANSVKSLLEGFLASLQQKGLDSSKVHIEVAKPVIGQTPWKPGNDPADPAYTAEQFVRLNVAISKGKEASPLSIYATRGEIIYDQGKRAFGTLHYRSSANGSGVTKSGDAILRLANGNTGQYLNKYVDIPAADVQKYFGTTNTVQSQQIAQQLAAAAKPVPQNDPLFGKTINDAH